MTFKISKSLLEEMDKISKEHHYSSRTEFIRTAIREKIERCKTVKFITQRKKHKKVSKRVIEYSG
tara:strand:+ start:398 stop:592 length:195 start_codon:yes stop_codon:yes gene_type:complete